MPCASEAGGYGYGGSAAGHIDAWRREQHPQLLRDADDTVGLVYADHAGATLAGTHQIRAATAAVAESQFVPANPHSTGPAAGPTMEAVERVRRRLLRFFGADEEEYVLVFTSGGWAGKPRAEGRAPTLTRMVGRCTRHLRDNVRQCARGWPPHPRALHCALPHLHLLTSTCTWYH